MRKFYTLLTLTAFAASTVALSASAQKRIPIQEEKPIQMYALGASGTSGVYKINLTDVSNPTQLNTVSLSSTGRDYTGSNVGGGGVFLSPDEVVGVKYNYGCYAFLATSEGSDGIAWAPTVFKSASSYARVYDMVYDEQDDKIFCIYKAGSYDYNTCLGVYDKDNQTITNIGSNGSMSTLNGIAIDSEGQLWGLGNYGEIFTINKATGAVTSKGSASIQFNASSCISATIDPKSNVMYVMAKTSQYATVMNLLKIDLETLTAENLGEMPGFYNCLTIIGSSIPEGAPAPVENLTASFNGEATIVSFTAPTITAGGKNLSGELTYTINVDNEEVFTGTINAGESTTVEINPADGKHQISVTVSNTEGTSKSAKTEVFSGYDTPGALTGLTANVNGTTVSLKWVTPEGANGGQINLNQLTYTVSRNGEVIATGLTDTDYNDNVFDKYLEYTYTVTEVYKEEVSNSASTSVFAGSPWDVPYTIDLNVSTPGQAGIKVLDPNTGNSVVSPTWVIAETDGAKCLQSYSIYVSNRTEYAYLPLTNLKKDIEYTLQFKVAAYTDNANQRNSTQGSLEVAIANEPTTDKEEYSLLQTYSIKNEGEIPVKVKTEIEFKDLSLNFKVDEDGDYYLALIEMANVSQAYAHHTTSIKDIALTANFPTPETVSGLEAIPQGDSNRNVELIFNLPTLDVDGEFLTSISKIDIYRGSQLIETMDGSFEPGENLSYTDLDVNRGFTSYHVVVFNGDKASAPAYVTVMVGYLNNLKITSVTAPDQGIGPNGEGSLTVTVLNDGFEQVSEGNYQVVLLCNGEIVDQANGETIKSDETREYTFNLYWAGSLPATVTYTVEIRFNGDEKTEDNSESVEVKFEKSNSVASTMSEGIEVSAANGIITVKGAEGLDIRIYTIEGHTVINTVTGNEFATPVLPSGIYIVYINGNTIKVNI